ncbi:LysR family transcriptional regulator [Saccharospirillum sp. HFRX-1]|uniref:LysR family transcriptional regulator n=1 Tax=unclassified Saccharospirillum TaxID=2633430 RepID=UPI0037205123
MRSELLADLANFQLVASQRSFTQAAVKAGVTQSALSQAIKRLEARLGVKLLARTTRSVSPTQAGERLLATLAPALADIMTEVDALADYRDRPAGRIRVTAGKHAAQTVLWPAAVQLMHEFPDIQVDISITSAYQDIVAEGFDAGIRLGEQVEKDMVAIPVGPQLRSAVVASPTYLEAQGRPQTPDELMTHRCICFRNAAGGIYDWEFERDGRPLSVRVGRGLVLNDGDLMVSAALEGFGLAHLMADMVADEVAAGRLESVLQDWCEPFIGYYLYYPSRKQPTQAFRLFLDALRRNRQ